MSKINPHTSKRYTTSLNMNSLRGRMFIAPKISSRLKIEFLIVYGQKSSIEKWSVLANELRNYGNVTMPDLPGIGGMQSFYKINEKPTLDNYADYLASFIKLRFNRKKIVLVGLSFGFSVITRTLQKYPELSAKVNALINVSGFVNNQDLKISSIKKKQLRLISGLLSHNVSSNLYKTIAYDEFVFGLTYKPNIEKSKFSEKYMKKLVEKELKLQKKNDIKSHMYVLSEMMKMDITHQSIDLPVWSLVSEKDEYIHHDAVRHHLEQIYSKCHEIKLKKNTHNGENILITPEDITKALPYKLKVLFTRLNK